MLRRVRVALGVDVQLADLTGNCRLLLDQFDEPVDHVAMLTLVVNVFHFVRVLLQIEQIALATAPQSRNLKIASVLGDIDRPSPIFRC